MFPPMKWQILLSSLLVCFATTILHAQQPPTRQDSLVALAERQQWDERFTAMNTRVEKLEEAIQTYQQQMHKMAEEIHSLREEISRLSGNNGANAATQRNLDSLTDAIKEVDRKRLADHESVMKALENLRKGVINQPVITPRASASSARSGSEKGFDYTVQSGDNSLRIAEKLKLNGIDVTPKQIVDANPDVVWTKLQIGQKVFIPAR